MEQSPQRRQDPLALAFFGAALALLAALLVYVFVLKTPEPAPAERSADVVERLRRKIADAADGSAVKPASRPSAPAVPAQQPAPASRPAAGAAPAIGAASALEPGRTWRYTVVVDPPIWRDITLTYRTQRESGGLGVLTDFVHAGGKSNFHLGTYAPGHPSHANTRFPGFFMYPSYFRLPLEPGQKFEWSWGWQPEREGRRKHWYAQVVRTERVTVPAGSFDALVIQLNLAYIEGGEVRARAIEFIWYAPELKQVVRILREGRTPDEGSSRIVAELAELR